VLIENLSFLGKESLSFFQRPLSFCFEYPLIRFLIDLGFRETPFGVFAVQVKTLYLIMDRPHFRFPFLFILFLIGWQQSRAQQNEFGWLVGKWKLTEKNVFEEWKVSSDRKTLEGLSYRIKGSDTIVVEKLLIKFEQSSFFYISDVAENPAPVKFKITQYNTDKFLAENPEHDFPKAIRYKLTHKDNQVFIEASIEGDGKVIPYTFSKVK
jgi:hypothetical protein